MACSLDESECPCALLREQTMSKLFVLITVFGMLPWDFCPFLFFSQAQSNTNSQLSTQQWNNCLPHLLDAFTSPSTHPTPLSTDRRLWFHPPTVQYYWKVIHQLRKVNCHHDPKNDVMGWSFILFEKWSQNHPFSRSPFRTLEIRHSPLEILYFTFYGRSVFTKRSLLSREKPCSNKVHCDELGFWPFCFFKCALWRQARD